MAITISGTDGITPLKVTNGTAAAPALTGDDTDSGIFFGTNEVNISTNGSTAATVDSSGRFLVGTTSSRSTFFGSSPAQIHLEKATAIPISAIVSNSNDTGPSYFALCKSRGAALGSHTIVQDNDFLGVLSFQGADGDQMVEAARIDCFVNGTPGDNDMPGALRIGTTADGSNVTTERIRIGANGGVAIKQQVTSFAEVDLRYTGTNKIGTTGIYAESLNIGTAHQTIYGVSSATASASGTRYALYGNYIAATGSPGGGVIGQVSAVYGILGYFDNTNSWALYGSGSTFISGTYQGSDSRLKDVVEPISTDVLSKLDDIQPIKYRWRENTDQRAAVGDGVFLGLIAQEVEQHFPEVIKEVEHACPVGSDKLSEGDFDSHKSLNEELGTFKTLEYSHMVPVLVAALKEAKERIETLETKVAELEAAE